MADLDRLTAQLKRFWASRTTQQRWLLGAGSAATIGLISVFANLVAAPDYKLLMSGLESGDAQTITADLKARSIPYLLSSDGKSVSVPSEKLDAARLEVASNQGTHSGRMGFEIFDKVSWGQTEFDEKVNYQRALEGELERTISSLGNVKMARVHLVMATDSVFLDRDRGAKASVTLRLKRGGLTREEASAIQRMVAGAVDGLKASDVSIIDADSNETLGLSSDPSSGDGLERLMTQRLVSTLGPVVGPDHLRTSVNVEYDSTTSEESEEKFDPNGSATLQIQRSDDESGSKPFVGGVPGTVSNVPQKLANVPVAVAGDGSNEIHKTESATYGVNKTTRHSVAPAGRIRRITAAILVDDEVVRKLEKDGKWSETPIKRSAQTLQQLQTLAQDAIGIDLARGDVITVQNLSFVTKPVVDTAALTLLESTRKGLSDYAVVIRYTMLLMLFVLAYLLMLRPLQRRVLADVVARPDPGTTAGPDATPMLPLSVTNGGMGTPALKEQLIQQVVAEPIKSARVLQAWMRERAE